jgi:methyl-accepting chemotaxis protein
MTATEMQSELEVALARAEAAEAELAAYRTGLTAIVGVCRNAAGGDLEPRVPALGDNPLVQDGRQALNHLLDLVDAFVREAAASLSAAREGQFYRKVVLRGLLGAFQEGARTINHATVGMSKQADALRQSDARRLALADAFEGAVQSVAAQVAAASTEMHTTAETLAQAAGHVVTQSAQANAAAVQVSNGITSIASATEEMTSTVAEIERQAAASNEAARGAVAASAQASATMQALTDAAQQIGQVVNVITQVANQTRLLALNATIEAARAGTAGKGFAVVAAEVKNLATQTAAATEQITTQVETIREATKRSVTAFGSIDTSIKSVEQVSQVITHAVGEQRIATMEISTNSHRAATSASEATARVSEVTQTTQETSITAGHVQSAAGELSRLAETLRQQVDEFLRDLREG